MTAARGQTEVKLLPPNGDLGDWYGTSAGIDGDFAVVGAMGEDGIGAAYAYERQGGVWTLVKRLQSADHASGDNFANDAFLDGNRLIIGARYKSIVGTKSGAAYIYERQNGTWEEIDRLVSNDLGSGDNFGQSVSIDGNLAVVGARRENSAETNAGAAYIFEFADGAWQQVAKIQSNEIQAEDRFGNAVSVSGSRVMVGSSGRAYMFELVSGVWTQVAMIQPADVMIGDKFANSLSLDGDRALIGADEGVYVYDLVGGAWTQTTLLTPTATDGADFFGNRVVLVNDQALVGAQNAGTGNLSTAGAAFLFELQNGSWSQIAELTASDRKANDRLGSSIALSAEYAIAGAPGASFQPVDAGAAYIFEFDGEDNSSPTASFTYSADAFEVDFDGTDSSDDGAVVQWSWDFGDGTDGDGPTPSHTFAAPGAYTVELTVTDDEGATGSTSQLVSVTDSGPAATIHIASITTVVVRNGGSGSAEATVLIVDENGLPVEAATVSGVFSEDVSGSDTDDTDASGEALLTSTSVTTRPREIGFCVDAVTHATLAYDPAANADPGFACAGAAPSEARPGSEGALTEAPASFLLHANYPNPFNPTTTIRFELAEASAVRLAVYDVMGRRVALLVDGHLAAGAYETPWDATTDAGAAVSSGLYLYRIEAGHFDATRRMILMK